MTAYRGKRSRVPIILSWALYGGKWSVSSLCYFISRNKSPRYPFNRKLEGTRTSGEKNILLLQEIKIED